MTDPSQWHAAVSALYAEDLAFVANHLALPIDVLSAQVQVESGGDPYAFRYEPAFFDRYIRHHETAAAFKYGPLAACSYGLLQILLETAMELGFADAPERLFVPRVGVLWGARYLRRCVDRAGGDVFLGLQAYNGTGDAARDYAQKVWGLAGRR